MNIVNFSTQTAGPRAGFLVDDHVMPAAAVLPGAGAPVSIPDLLTALNYAGKQVTRALRSNKVPRLLLDEVRLHAPVHPGALILCTGGNYRSHLEEIGESVPDRAPSFVKNPNAVVGPEDPIVLPPQCPDMVDFEGELCVVFGRACHHVSAEQAMDYIGGYTILNDVSARNRMAAMLTATTPTEGRWSVIEMLMGKQLPTFAPVGPTILTAEEVPDPAALRLTTRLNGELMQDASVGDLVVGVPQLVEQMSRYYNFAPGDLLSTGTPAGIGAGQVPPRYLRPRDEVTIEITGIGALRNRAITNPTPERYTATSPRRKS